jgi:ribose 5-phosphate isomerase B
MEKQIIIGSDHGGFDLKEQLKAILEEKSYQVSDAGCYDTSSVNYPDIARKVSMSIANGEFNRGILVCGTGIGMSIAANRIPNIRATLCHDHFTAKMSREHNNSNVLVLGGRVLGVEIANEILDTWLNTDFSGGRHQMRCELIDEKSAGTNN